MKPISHVFKWFLDWFKIKLENSIQIPTRRISRFTNLIRYIVNYNNTMSATIITWCNSSKSLLASRIPNLKLYRFTVQFYSSYFLFEIKKEKIIITLIIIMDNFLLNTYKVNADCAYITFCICVVLIFFFKFNLYYKKSQFNI